MINKIKTIIFSRFKKPKETNWIKERRSKCAKCTFNTKNIEKLSIRVRIIKSLSDLYSTITGNRKVDNLGNCTACEICSIYYKTAESVEYCPAKPKKWGSVKGI
jgi:hypothetical protein